MTISYNSNYDGTIPFSDTDFQVALGSNVEQLVNVPIDPIADAPPTQYQALFSYNKNSNVFVCKNSTPVIPTPGSVGTQQFNEFRPEKRYVKAGDVIHLITSDASAFVGVSLRKLQG